MGYTLDEFLKKFELKLKTMDIDETVSPFPRKILLPECPKCKNNLFLSHPIKKPDPFIESKREEGIFGEKLTKRNRWIIACWTANCDFVIPLKQKELLQCPECKQYYLNDYSLYDHMRFQCTDKAQSTEMLKKAGVEKYAGGLMVI